MPVSVSYPGVYIEEIPSGVRTIDGVATSITGFAGWTSKGPIDRAESVFSWSEFERKFGGLDAQSLLGYSVYHFFNNGGKRAYIVRLVGRDAATARVRLGDLSIMASGPGAWANDYAIATKKRADDSTRFDLVVNDMADDAAAAPIEIFEDLSMDTNDPRFVGSVLHDDSTLVRVDAIDVADTIPSEDTTRGDPIDEARASARLKGGMDGTVLQPNSPDFDEALLPADNPGGLYHLDRVDLFNLLCVPGETNEAVITRLQHFCRQRRAFLIADCSQDARFDDMKGGLGDITGDDSINTAFYFPWVVAPDDLNEDQEREFPPCGFVAGIYARTDATRGVWKAAAGREASLTGVTGIVPEKALTADQNGVLNPKAINCIRKFPGDGTVVWGARTLRGSDEHASEWKYVPVRRMALFIEESLVRGLRWTVFEPNDEPLWAQIRLNVGSFLHGLFRQGAFQGTTPKEAYFVKCDRETTTQSDVDSGTVNIVVGFAPLKPAEFVIIKLQQMAGQEDPGIETLAQRIVPQATRDAMVLPRDEFAVVDMIVERSGPGTSALFVGRRGTGKTLAAEVIANELGLDLYRIDMSAVVSKYIGETEKNLRRIFDSAERSRAVLFFDEADALFGKRTEVEDSHDRFANIEIGYLLQRMENYAGIAILATNRKRDIDEAFLRRLRYVVNFPT